MNRTHALIACLFGFFSHAVYAEGEPKALILGDSISIGYTKPVVELLRGKADVHRPNANCGSTLAGLEKLDKWIEGGPWKVIHFNWGLHDLCYRNPDSKAQGNRDKINGKISVPLEQYQKNIETLVERLEKTGAKLIFATTTVVPEGETGRFAGDDVKYNAAAEAVMKKHGISIDDLHALSKTFAPGLFQSPGNVHYKPEGYQKLAEQVAASIARELP
jgi:lysophospholipase L1-like esterase